MSVWEIRVFAAVIVGLLVAILHAIERQTEVIENDEDEDE